MKKHKEEDDIILESDVSGEIDDVSIADEETLDTGKAAKVAKELKQCRVQKQEYLDGWQRAKADYVNALRRFEEEKIAIKGRSTAQIIEAFLPALDSLNRAQEAGKLPDGFDAIAKQLTAAFTKLGVSEVSAKIGSAFDPVYHEALGQDKTDNAALDNTISAVLEKGWQTGNVVIRPAKVRVVHHS